MTPDDAFDYLKTLNYVDMVALGIASEDEAEETFHKLFNADFVKTVDLQLN